MEDQVNFVFKILIQFNSRTIKNFSGLWGLIAAGLFKTEGLMSSGSVTILIWNSIGAAIIIAWHAVCGSIMFFVLKKLGLFRIAAKLEESGLDVPYHDEPAYIFTSRKGQYFNS